MKKVFLVILNWNGYKDTYECLKSIEKMKSPDAETTIVVVDNGSKEDLPKLKKIRIKHYPIVILRNVSNLGYAEGNNTGIRYALKNAADFIVIINNDVLVDRDLLKNFLVVAKYNENVAAMTPKIYFAPGFEFHKDRYGKKVLGRVIWSAGGNIDWNNVYGSTRGVDEVDRGRFDKIEETGFANGTCLFLRVDALRKVGIFDSKYYLYYEDTDLSMRLRKNGWKILYIPTAVCWHKVSQSSGIGSELNDYYTTRNRMLFGMKYAGLRAKLALIRESFKLALKGRTWQKRGIVDFYLGKFGKGSWR